MVFCGEAQKTGIWDDEITHLYLKNKFWNEREQFWYLHHPALSYSLIGKHYFFRIFELFWILLVIFHGFNIILILFCFETVFFGLLDAKPYRTIMKLPQKLSFGPEACEIWPKVGTWTCPSCPKSSKWGRNPPENKGLVFCWLHKSRNTQGNIYGKYLGHIDMKS